MEKELTSYGVGSFSFHLQRSSPKSSLTERSTYLVRISAPAPCGRHRGPISPGRVRSATPYFSDCPNQCAALYLVRISAPAPCGRNRGAISPGRVRTAMPYFSDCPDQRAALYLVRILSAARSAGFRQAKSPGRVGRCRISEHPPSTIIRHYCFFLRQNCLSRSLHLLCLHWRVAGALFNI